MNPFLKYGAFLFAIISFIDFFTALSAGSAGEWSIAWFDVSYTAYLGFKLVSGIVLVAYGFGVGVRRDVKKSEVSNEK